MRKIIVSRHPINEDLENLQVMYKSNGIIVTVTEHRTKIYDNIKSGVDTYETRCGAKITTFEKSSFSVVEHLLYGKENKFIKSVPDNNKSNNIED